MSYSKSSAAIKESGQKEENVSAQIIPWPDVSNFLQPSQKPQKARVRLDTKYLYYKGRRIPILQFQKAGYENILKLLVKEIGG